MTVDVDSRPRGIIFGRSLDFRPQPTSAEVLANPIKLTDLEVVQLPAKTWRDKARIFLQSSGLSTIPRPTRLRWQAHEVLDWLQGSLLGKGRGRRIAVTHPNQLLGAIDFLLGIPPELDVERRQIQMLIGRGLIEYRKRINQSKDRPTTYAKEAANYFNSGFKNQQLVSKAGSSGEQFLLVQQIFNDYYFFRCNYMYHILSREPAESGNKLFSKFMRASFFMSTIQDDGSIAPKPSYRALPPKEHVVFLAKRDAALQSRLKEDEALRNEMQQVLKYFRPLR